MQQVGRVQDVGTRTDRAADRSACGERVDQSVDVLRVAEVLVGQTQQQRLLGYFPESARSTADATANGTALEDFPGSTPAGCQRRKFGTGTLAQQAAEQQVLRQHIGGCVEG